MLGGQGRRSTTARGLVSLGLGLWLLVACGDDESADAGGDGTITDTGSSDTDGEPPQEQIIPLDVATLELDARCFDLDVPPSQLSIAPEGQLWLRLDDATWRIVDPFGGDSFQSLPPTVTVLQAWGDDRAIVIDQASLWEVQGQWPQPLAWPTGLPEPTGMCGDPTRDANGFVLAEGLLHRDAGQWWEWTDPSDQPWDVAWLASNAGACIGSNGALWLARNPVEVGGEVGGEVWSITRDFAARVPELDGADQVALTQDRGVAAIVEGDLLVGDVGDLIRYHFEAGTISALSAGGESVWVLAGDALHRLQDGEVTAATGEGVPVGADQLLAEAGGGVWALTPTEACHLRASPPVAVEGLHNLERRDAETMELVVRVDADASLDSATLDGEPVPMEPDGPGRWRAPPLPVAEGWHALELLASGSAGTTTRRLSFEQRRVGDLTWQTDVEPVFLEHCSGGSCHGPDLPDSTRPDLSTWEAWIEREDAILDRVVTKGDMPPAAALDDTWGLELQLLISQWYETGAEQGDG